MQELYNLNKEEKVFLELLSAAVHHTGFTGTSLNEAEWKKVFQLAGKHNVLPLVFEKAAETEGFMEMFGNSSVMMKVVAGVSKQAQRTEAFLQLYQKLQEAGVSPVVMKGIICRQLYGEYCNHRPSGDEDILIRKEDYEMVKKVSVENGYLPEEKYENITVKEMETLQEITFRNKYTGLVIEVHINPTGYENKLRGRMNDYFISAFERSKIVNIQDVNITTMSDSDHYLYLVFHAFRHFTVGGLGIRQVMDILLYEKVYASKIDWKYIKTSVREVGAEGFLNDLHWIGNTYLGFGLYIEGKERCPEELLRDLLENGAFGNATQAQRTAERIVSDAMQREMLKSEGSGKRLFYTFFPTKEKMEKSYPEIKEKPYLLPFFWFVRWRKFLTRNKKKGGKVAVESIEISQRRMELLKKYNI